MGGPISQCCCPPGTADYKVVGALVTWFGLDDGAVYGYANCIGVDVGLWQTACDVASPCSSYIPYSATPPPHKYLGKTEDVVWHQRATEAARNTCPSPQPDTYERITDVSFILHRDDHIDRYTGDQSTVVDARWILTVTSTNPAENSTVELTGQDAIDAATAAHCPYLSASALCLHVFTVPDVITGYTQVLSECTDTTIKLAAEKTTDTGWVAGSCPPPNTGIMGAEDRFTTSGTCTVDVIKYDQFTAAEVWAMAVDLLAQWALSNDTNYPWRTACAGNSYRYGPMVQHDYHGTFSGVPGAIIGAPYGADTWDTGVHSHPGYVSDGMSGGSAEYVRAANVWGWDNNTLVLGKWAEKKTTVPRHNYARPCGVDHWCKVDTSYASDLCWPPATRTATLTSNGTNVSDGDTVTIYDTDTATTSTYTFRTVPSVARDVLIGANATASMLNLKNKINALPDPLVTASVAGLVLTIAAGAATRYYHFYETSTGAATLAWGNVRMTGPVCTAPCNTTTSTGDYVVIESIWDFRLVGEATRINVMNATCGGYSPCTAAFNCGATPCPVPSLWTNTCASHNAAVGDILYVSPNTETFGGTSYGYSFAAALNLDDAYGNVWFKHIRQAMPDPLTTCAGLTSWVMEEAECTTPGGCTALPSPSIFYCPDETTSVAVLCGVQDSYGMQCPPA